MLGDVRVRVGFKVFFETGDAFVVGGGIGFGRGGCAAFLVVGMEDSIIVKVLFDFEFERVEIWDLPVSGTWTVGGDVEDDGCKGGLAKVSEVKDVEFLDAGIGDDIVGFASAEGENEALMELSDIFVGVALDIGEALGEFHALELNSNDEAVLVFKEDEEGKTVGREGFIDADVGEDVVADGFGKCSVEGLVCVVGKILGEGEAATRNEADVIFESRVALKVGKDAFVPGGVGLTVAGGEFGEGEFFWLDDLLESSDEGIRLSGRGSLGIGVGVEVVVGWISVWVVGRWSSVWWHGEWRRGRVGLMGLWAGRHGRGIRDKRDGSGCSWLSGCRGCWRLNWWWGWGNPRGWDRCGSWYGGSRGSRCWCCGSCGWLCGWCGSGRWIEWTGRWWRGHG